LPADRPLSAVRVQIDGDRVIVRDNSTSWEPESKQTLLDFNVRELGEKVAPLARESVQRALHSAGNPDELFEAALESEEIGASGEAELAYRRVLESDLDHVAARINLGRLRHQARALDDAERLYREALALDPKHHRALQSRRRARRSGRDQGGDRGVRRGRAARSTGGGRALQSCAALSAGRRRGTRFLLAVRAHTRRE
jgi:tetratricopeptide (TPR) repeat protein